MPLLNFNEVIILNINVALWIVIAIIIGYTSGLLVYFSKKITFKNILPVLLLTPCFVLLMIPSVFLFVIQKKDGTFKKKLLFYALHSGLILEWYHVYPDNLLE